MVVELPSPLHPKDHNLDLIAPPPAIFLALPWIVMLAVLYLRLREPKELGASVVGRSGPRVSIVVPARNESHNIATLLRSLAATTYPEVEIIVVDDRSEDGTGGLARSLAEELAVPIEVIEGEQLPAGWLGKPWACAQGAGRARGELLLFTDADTVHQPELLDRSVSELERERADALSVIGRQLMETFWEKLVQPHVFMMLFTRYGDLSRDLPQERWRDAIANGQFILMRRDAYDGIGGHGLVKGEVAEDLRLAQEMVKAGLQYRLRSGNDVLATRMYRSLGEIVDGWTKNVIPGGLQTLPPWTRRWAGLLILPPIPIVWFLPFLVGLASPILPWQGADLWAGIVIAASILFWANVSRRMGSNPWYGFLYPLATVVTFTILVRSWWGRSEVTWKGRSYRLKEGG